MKTAKLLLIAGILGSLSSCMDLRVDLAFRNAESGTLALNYRIDRRALEIGMFDTGATILPLPVGQRDFERTAASIPDLELRSYRMRQQDGTTVIDAEYSFSSVVALSALFGNSTALTVQTVDGRTRFRHHLFDGFPDGVGESGEGFAESFLADGNFSMRVTTPAAVTGNNLGQVEASGRTVRLDYTVAELLKTRDPVLWEVVW